MAFWTYMLHCRGGAFYVGHTEDLDTRIATHKTGALKGWTSRYLPCDLVWSEEFAERYEAIAAERQIKGWSRKKKLALIRSDWDEISRLAKSKSGPSTSSGRTEIRIDQRVLDALLREAESAHPQECCGLLLGRDGAIEAMQSARNVHPDPGTHFEIDPATLIAAYRDERAGGPSLVGFYHSHPNGVARPSATDAACAAGDGKLWAIIAGGEVALWRDQPGGFAPLSYVRDKR